jgi:hypothetical protein
MRRGVLGEIGALKSHVPKIGIEGALTGDIQSLCVGIDADDFSSRPSDFGRDEGDVADAAAEVEDTHAGCQTRCAKEALR